jgi:hypothetical protein
MLIKLRPDNMRSIRKGLVGITVTKIQVVDNIPGLCLT